MRQRESVSQRTTQRRRSKRHASKKSKLEETLALHMRSVGIEYEREVRFHPVRKWRFDFAIVDLKIGIECEGLGAPGASRHTANDGFTRDCEKYNAATLLDWAVLRFTWNMIKSGHALNDIERLIERRMK